MKIFQKIGTHVIVATLLCSLVVPSSVLAQITATQAPLFTDVTESDPHFSAIKFLKDSGAVKGYADGSYKPSSSITRAESLAILLKISGITSEKSSVKLSFSDVKEDSWFYPMVQKGIALKKIKGFDDGTFKPLANITLPETMALTFSFVGIDASATPVEGVIYKGLDSKAWYARVMQYAKNTFIVSPSLVTTAVPMQFDATAPITRGEFAEIVYRSKKVKTSGALDITSSWIQDEHKENFWQLRHPQDWAVFKGSANSVLWNKKTYSAFYTRVWPTGVRLSLSVVENENKTSANAYFDQLRQGYNSEYGATNVLYFNQNISGLPAIKIVVPSSNIVDQHLALPNGKFLTFYGEYGSAPIAEFYKKQLELVVASYRYVEAPPAPPKPIIPLEERLQTLRTNVLIEGGWSVVKDLFADKKLISTDGIGVGTGPVDYYFTAEGNTTIKLERNSATILNIREGQTTNF